VGLTVIVEHGSIIGIVIAKESPFHFLVDDGTGSIMEIILPGVEKDSIKLKMNNDNLVVFGESDSINYGAIFQLCCPVDPEKAKTIYKNGLLKIEVPYVDMLKDTIDVKIE